MSGASGEVKTNMEIPEIISCLVVDCDTANRKFIGESLRYLGCKVKACKYREQAFSLLREQKQGFDIVLAGVNIPYEMGLKFVEIVSSKMNIPIIMMCSTRDNEIIAAGMNSGASQVAVKPFGINDAERFLQCALDHRRRHLLGISNSARNSEGLHGQENGSNQGTIVETLYKDRLVWTEDIEARFVAAVQALGGKYIAMPKKILELMNVPNITRENIASHLQKYRLYSDPNYVGGKRKRKAAQAMQIDRINEKAPVVAHPNRCVLSFMPEVFRDSRGPSPPAHSSFELQVPSNGITSRETPTSLDAKRESFLAMDLSDPNFLFFDEYHSQDMSMIYGGLSEYPSQDMSMIYGGLSNGLHDNNYPVGQLEMGNGDLYALNDRITNDSATDSLIKGNPEIDYPVATHYPQNISAMGGIIDHSNNSEQQQEQIGGSPLEQPGSISGLGSSESSTFGQGTSEPSTFGQVPRNGSVWFIPKPPGDI